MSERVGFFWRPQMNPDVGPPTRTRSRDSISAIQASRNASCWQAVVKCSQVISYSKPSSWNSCDVKLLAKPAAVALSESRTISGEGSHACDSRHSSSSWLIELILSKR